MASSRNRIIRLMPGDFRDIEFDEEGIPHPIWTNEYVKIIIHNRKTYCQDMVSSNFIEEAFQKADIVYIAIVNKKPRCFACVNDREDHYYIDLICCAPYSRVRTRHGYIEQKLTGKNILEQIRRDAIHHRKKYIKLSALEGVITYYHRYGYRFIRRCGDVEPDWVPNLLRELRIAQTEGDDEEAVNILTGRHFIKFVSDMYAEEDLRERLDPDVLSPYARKIAAMDCGFTMILCLEDSKTTRAGTGGRHIKKRRKKTRRRKKRIVRHKKKPHKKYTRKN